MTKEVYIHWLENMIQGCIDLGDMYREKAIYQNCLKMARKIEKKEISKHDNSFNFKKLEQKLDNVLDNETSETLKEWINSKRKG